MTADEMEREHREFLVSVARAERLRVWLWLAFQAAGVALMWGALAGLAVAAWRSL